MYEDDWLAVVDKPAGMVVHPAPGHPSGTLADALKARGSAWSLVGGEERAGIVHRLDRDTSGLLVVAKTEAAHRALASQLRDPALLAEHDRSHREGADMLRYVHAIHEDAKHHGQQRQQQAHDDRRDHHAEQEHPARQRGAAQPLEDPRVTPNRK